jgi:p-cumate 2,3-dioxygenase beta subunit
VRLLDATEDTVTVRASFVVYRFREGRAAPYVGRYDYTLLRAEDGLKIRYRRATLDQESLQEHGAISIIL